MSHDDFDDNIPDAQPTEETNPYERMLDELERVRDRSAAGSESPDPLGLFGAADELPDLSDLMEPEPVAAPVSPPLSYLQSLEQRVRANFRTLAPDGAMLPFDTNDDSPWGFLYDAGSPEYVLGYTVYLDLLYDHIIRRLYMTELQTSVPPTPEQLTEFKSSLAASASDTGILHRLYWYVFAHLPRKLTDAFNLLVNEAFVADMRASLTPAEFAEVAGGEKKAYPSKIAEALLRGERKAMGDRIIEATNGPADPEPEVEIDLPGNVIPRAIAELKKDVVEKLKLGRNGDPPPEEVAKRLAKRCTSAELAKHTEGYGVGGRALSPASIRRFVKALYPEAEKPMEELKRSLMEGG